MRNLPIADNPSTNVKALPFKFFNISSKNIPLPNPMAIYFVIEVV
jgi:hypothetical protein